ncbi:hypothetical protein RCG23_01700 [Neobacillus sp. PS3-34]|uniref:hypothetical protein n=1 Tax=Neobacillus sp. PS3-34 TaxID=3070678 RepID=UPI0027E10B47|nr:hypothetical protein [Neobacillus sp. PS3-34]WML48867.1 hypothetical protein RCG23_01700 [Neobacillus sp. PS3-34]
MKKQLLTGLLALSLTIPGVAAAEGFKSEMADHSRYMESGKHHSGREHCKGKMEERETMLLSWVEKYTPEQKDRWNQAIKERKEIVNKWHSPQFAKKREEWKRARMAKKAELKKQVEEGKISKEEMKQKFREKRQKFHKMKQEHYKTFNDLQTAVKNNDQKQAAQLLDKILVQMEQHNKWMKDKMNAKQPTM